MCPYLSTGVYHALSPSALLNHATSRAYSIVKSESLITNPNFILCILYPGVTQILCFVVDPCYSTHSDALTPVQIPPFDATAEDWIVSPLFLLVSRGQYFFQENTKKWRLSDASSDENVPPTHKKHKKNTLQEAK